MAAARAPAFGPRDLVGFHRANAVRLVFLLLAYVRDGWKATTDPDLAMRGWRPVFLTRPKAIGLKILR